MTTASDNFDRADEVPISSPWAASVGAARLVSNQLTSASGAYGISRYASGTWADDQEVEATVAARQSDAYWAFIAVRMDASGNGFAFETDGTSANSGLTKFVAGSETSFTTPAADFAVGDRMRLRVEGQSPDITLTAWKQTGGVGDWVQVAQVTGWSGNDSGVPGGGAYSLAGIANWSATDELGGGGSQALEGAATGGATASGAASIEKPIAGDAGGGATASGTLAVSGDVELAGAAAGGASASADLSVVSRSFEFTLYAVDGSTPLASKSGLWWAWWPSIAAMRSAAPDASGTGASTDASGVFRVGAPASLSVGTNQGFGIISDQDSTPDATEAAYVGSFDVV